MNAFCVRCSTRMIEGTRSKYRWLLPEDKYCPKCGKEPRSMCPDCYGSGTSRFAESYCPECGEAIAGECGRCGGSGTVFGHICFPRF